MTEDEALARLVHDMQVRETLERSEEALEASRRREVPAETWTAPAQSEPPRAAPQPAPRPRAAASPSPPMPDKVTIPQHDASGRIVAAVSYTGASVSQAVSWERFVFDSIDRRVGAAVKKWVNAQLEAFGEAFAEGLAEIENELSEKRRLRFEAIEARLALLEQSEPSRHVVVPALQSAVSGTTPTAGGSGSFHDRGRQLRSRSAMHDAA